MTRANVLVLILVCIAFTAFGFAGDFQADFADYEYLNPPPSSQNIHPQTTVSIRWGQELTSAPSVSDIIVIGTRSGRIAGEVVLARDTKTIVFKPAHPFTLGESVTVEIQNEILPALSFNFTIRERVLSEARLQQLKARISSDEDLTHSSSQGLDEMDLDNPRTFQPGCGFELDEVSIPSDFPTYTISGNGNAADGYFCMSAMDRTADHNVTYLVIMNNIGEVVWYKKGYTNVFNNFTPYPSCDRFTFRIGGGLVDYAYVMDQNFVVIDSMHAQNGYLLDGHEFLMREDGSMWVITRDPQIIDMSEIVEGGLEDAVCQYFAMQHLDADNNLLYEWHSGQHMDELPFEDIDNQQSLTHEEFEHLHTNSIDICDNGDLLISDRTMSTVERIDIETGDVLWRMGCGRGNQFTFIDDLEDNPGFSRQHDARWHADNHMTVFDNGNNHPTPTAYGREYIVDEENLTAQLIWNVSHESASSAQGGMSKLSNGNRLVSWGMGQAIGGSEHEADGSVAWAIEWDRIGNQRSSSFKYHKTETFWESLEPYVCAVVPDGETNITLYLNWFGHEDEVASYNIYWGTEPHPTTLLTNVTEGIYTVNDLDFGQTYYVRITAIDQDNNESDFSSDYLVQPFTGVKDNQIADPPLPYKFMLESAWPNPFNPSTSIALTLPQRADLNVTVYNVMGREVAQLANNRFDAGRHTFQFNGSSLASGVYFVKATMNGGQTQTMKITLMK